MGTKKFGYEQICVRKNWVQKNVGTKKKLVIKKIRVRKTIWVRKKMFK